MKHPGARASLAPEQIGREVRHLIDAFLHAKSNVPIAFPERMEKLATEIARWGAKTNLTAHPEDPEEVTFHILDSLAPLVQASSGIPLDGLGEGHRVLDLGSGAGFPGLVLAAACAADFTLIEARRKRASFLQVVTAAMQLRNVVIETRRAELLVAKSNYDVVTARAFGEVSHFLRLAASALKPSGLAILYANPGQPLAADIADVSGLEHFQRLPYDVQRRTGKVQRILAVWTRRNPQDVDV